MKNGKDWLGIILLILFAPVLLFFALAWLIVLAIFYPFAYFHEQRLKYQFYQHHGKHGRFALFVYSDSPNWKDYIETNILSRIKESVVTLNWSERRNWEKTNPFEAKVFYQWTGEKEHNPIAIIFTPSGKVKDVKFWHAFKDFKHGKDETLREAEQTLYEEIENCRSEAT
jgi:hypothetical protein